MNDIILAFGANLEDPIENIKKALKNIEKIKQINLLKSSSFYNSAPHFVTKQNNFINSVALLQSTLKPQKILEILEKIEQEIGKKKIIKYGPRKIDIDIILYANQFINLTNPKLVIPHYDYKNRAFVIFPLFEIAPDLILPCGTLLKDLIKDPKLIKQKLTLR